MKVTPNLVIASLIIIFGCGIIAIAILGNPRELQIALGLAGLSFVFSGYLQFVQDQDKKNKRKYDEERHRQLLATLEEMKQELGKVEESRNKTKDIADAISSGLKLYSEFMTRPEGEKHDD